MVNRAAMGLVVLGAAVSTGAQQAQAGLSVCNASSFRISVAVGYVDRQEGWVSEGWWIVDAGDCKAAISSPLSNRFYYVYAQGVAEHSATKFSGTAPFCIRFEKFKLYQAQYGKDTEDDCSRAGLRSAKFLKVDTNNLPNHTVKLSGDDNAPVGSAGPVAQPAPAIQQRAPAPPAAPSGGGASTACQRFPNLC